MDTKEKVEEEKKKIKYDLRLFVDGIPMDEKHVVDIDEVDKRLDEIVAKDQKELKRLKKRK